MDEAKFEMALGHPAIQEAFPELREVTAKQLLSLWNSSNPKEKHRNPLSKECIFAVGVVVGVRLTGGK